MRYTIDNRPIIRLDIITGAAVIALLAAIAAVGISAWSPAGTLAVVAGAGSLGAIGLVLPQTVRFVKQFAAAGHWEVLWALLFLSSLVLRIRTTAEAAAAPLDLATAYRIALVMLVGLGILAAMSRRNLEVITSLTRGLFLPLTIFTAVNLLSAFWSDNIPWTVYKSTEYGIDLALIAAIVAAAPTIREYRRLVNWTWLLFGLLLGAVWLNVLLVPGQAIVRDLGTLGIGIEGVYPAVSRNGVGDWSAILAAVAFARLMTSDRNRGVLVMVLFAMLVTLALSQTRSATAGLLVAVPLILTVTKKGNWVLTLVPALLALVFLFGLTHGIEDFFIRGETDAQLKSLSGRTDYWSFALERFRERPLTGFGAFSGGRFEVAAVVGHSTLPNTHSTWIEILIGTSLWGVIPVALALLATWWSLGRRMVRHMASGFPFTDESALLVEALGVLAVLTVRSFFTVTLISHPPLEFLIVLGYAELLRRRYRLREPGGVPRRTAPTGFAVSDADWARD